MTCDTYAAGSCQTFRHPFSCTQACTVLSVICGPVGESFRHLQRGPTPDFGDQVPDATAARAVEESPLPDAYGVRHHFIRVLARQPLGLAHCSALVLPPHSRIVGAGRTPTIRTRIGKITWRFPRGS